MKSSLIELVRSAFGPKDEKFRQRLSIFLVCLLISVIIWFSIRLSNNFNAVIEIPVTFSNLPKSKVLTRISDSLLHVEVVEKGSDLFRLQYIQKIRPATLNLKNISLYNQNGVYEGIVIPSVFINDIEHEHNLLGKIISIRPDTIYLTFENRKSRKLPVKASLGLTYEKECMIYGEVKYQPDSVMVRGPAKLVENLENAPLGTLSLKNLKENTTAVMFFKDDTINQLLEFSPPSVTVTIPVEKYTESEVITDIRIINNRHYRIKTFPDKARVSFKVALKDYGRIEPGMIRTVADFSEVNITVDEKVRIQVDNFPDFIEISKIDPEKAEFIIIK